MNKYSSAWYFIHRILIVKKKQFKSISLIFKNNNNLSTLLQSYLPLKEIPEAQNDQNF